jgi:hypothetical protein
MVYQVAAYVTPAPSAAMHRLPIPDGPRMLDHTIALALDGGDSVLLVRQGNPHGLQDGERAAWARARLSVLTHLASSLEGALPAVKLPCAIVDLGHIHISPAEAAHTSDIDVRVVTMPRAPGGAEKVHLPNAIREALRRMAAQTDVPFLVVGSAGIEMQTTPAQLEAAPSAFDFARAQQAAAQLIHRLEHGADRLEEPVRPSAEPADAAAPFRDFLADFEAGSLLRDRTIAAYEARPRQILDALHTHVQTLCAAVEQGLHPDRARTLLRDAIGTAASQLEDAHAQRPVTYDIVDEFSRPDGSSWPLAVPSPLALTHAQPAPQEAFWSELDRLVLQAEEAGSDEAAAERLGQLRGWLAGNGRPMDDARAASLPALLDHLVRQELIPVVAEEAAALRSGGTTVPDALDAIDHAVAQICIAHSVHTGVMNGQAPGDARLMAEVQHWGRRLAAAQAADDVVKIKLAITQLSQAVSAHEAGSALPS